MGVHGWRLVSLFAAALLGGYCLANALGIFLAGALPLPRGQAVVAGQLIGLAAHAAIILWVFHLRRPVLVWGILLPASAALAAAGMLMGGSLA
ncbi:hypothetical protein [Haliea atlantica]|nr:hypothetical protein [Haliea sp.]MAL96281.1 hypothetical protein [Haliea sp.]|tara:strand:- start:214 stop:492 length:279 start_codon:yes stop_codon:yes gene_type:complete